MTEAQDGEPEIQSISRALVSNLIKKPLEGDYNLNLIEFGRLSSLEHDLDEGKLDKGLASTDRVMAISAAMIAVSSFLGPVLGGAGAIWEEGLEGVLNPEKRLEILSKFAGGALLGYLVGGPTPRTAVAYATHFLPLAKKEFEENQPIAALWHIFAPILGNFEGGWLLYPFITDPRLIGALLVNLHIMTSNAVRIVNPDFDRRTY